MSCLRSVMPPSMLLFLHTLHVLFLCALVICHAVLPSCMGTDINFMGPWGPLQGQESCTCPPIRRARRRRWKEKTQSPKNPQLSGVITALGNLEAQKWEYFQNKFEVTGDFFKGNSKKTFLLWLFQYNITTKTLYGTAYVLFMEHKTVDCRTDFWNIHKESERKLEGRRWLLSSLSETLSF